MPSERIARHIAESLAEGERQEDFEYMVDALTHMRRPYHPETTDEEVEEVAGWTLCIVVKPKPRHYIDAMQRFRILFKGIADSPELQATFANSVRLATLTAGEQLEYIPSLYFSWDPILSRGNLRKADLSGLQLHRAYLTGAYLYEANLQEANLSNADLHEAYLTGANLQGAHLYRADLTGANLQGTNLQEADLRVANLPGANLTRANLTRAVFRAANLGGTKLTRANLTGADVRGAYLRGADLQGADLQEAYLTGADLRRANLTGADLQEVRGLTQEQLEQAVGDEDTEPPEYLSVPTEWWS
jgi:uncharacterized protein YjbI with pentapeptide repeats